MMISTARSRCEVFRLPEESAEGLKKLISHAMTAFSCDGRASHVSSLGFS